MLGAPLTLFRVVRVAQEENVHTIVHELDEARAHGERQRRDQDVKSDAHLDKAYELGSCRASGRGDWFRIPALGRHGVDRAIVS